MTFLIRTSNLLNIRKKNFLICQKMYCLCHPYLINFHNEYHFFF